MFIVYQEQLYGDELLYEMRGRNTRTQSSDPRFILNRGKLEVME